jgi:prevent-host-death family protein
MATVTIQEAKTQLSRLIARVEAGEEIVIARGKVPVARLMPVLHKKKRPPAGFLKGKVSIPDSFFFGPLPEEELRLWAGGDEDSSR